MRIGRITFIFASFLDLQTPSPLRGSTATAIGIRTPPEAALRINKDDDILFVKLYYGSL